MLKLLRRLLGFPQDDPAEHGSAQSDWSPVPENQSPSGGWYEWLEQPPPSWPPPNSSASAPVTTPTVEARVPAEASVRHPCSGASPSRAPAAPLPPRQPSRQRVQRSAKELVKGGFLAHLSAEEQALVAQQQRPSRLAPRVTPIRTPRHKPQNLPQLARSISADFLQNLSAEERAVLEQQHHPGPLASRLTPVKGIPKRPASPKRLAHTPRNRIQKPSATSRLRKGKAVTGRLGKQNAPATPAPAAPAVPAACPASAAPKWTEMLQAYGEHLTDEEILALRTQLE